MKKKTKKGIKKIPIKNILLTLLVMVIVFATFLYNIWNDAVYYLYAITTLLLFIMVKLLKRYFKRYKDIGDYLGTAEQYHLATGIIFAFALLIMKLKMEILTYVFVFAGSFTFALGFLKTLVFSLRRAK